MDRGRFERRGRRDAEHIRVEGPRFVVYSGRPGRVARGAARTAVLMVLVTRREVTCVDVRGLATPDRPT
jgi:hypothetical protein